VNIYPTGRIRESYYPYPTHPVDIPIDNENDFSEIKEFFK